MSKRKLLLKDITRKAVIAAAITGLLGGIYYFVSSMSDGEDEQQRKLRSEIQNNRNQTSQLEQLVQDAGVAGEIFAKLSEDRDVMTFDIQRTMLPDILSRLNERYLLNGLNLALQQPQDFTHAELGAVKRQAVVIDFKVTFSAMSDSTVYAFVNDMIRSTPGFMKVTELKVTRRADLNVEALNLISQGNFVEAVAAEVAVRWYGFRPVVAEETTEGDADAEPAY
jgi:hypothetical protein